MATAHHDRDVAPRRVLVADDYPDAAETACLLLERFGHDCRHVTSGREAIDGVDGFVPDVAIIDLDMGDVSGHEVARHLRQRFGRDIFLVALTGWANADGAETSRAAGFDLHLVKPIDSVQLRQLIAAGSPTRERREK
jgi:CheY-like chemotaxis protein